MRSLLILALSMAAALAIAETPASLDIYAIDVEGGKATLVVSPSRESMLIDTGNTGDGALRDANRIMAAIKDAGIRQIDYLVSTHWHRDHIGGMALVASRIPVRRFIDHGANVQPDPAVDAFLWEMYPTLYAKAKHVVVKPGDKIPLSGLDVRVVASAGQTITAPLAGQGAPNPYCDLPKPPAIANSENTQSIGLHMTFGKLRILDLSDLGVAKEFDLMCPNNLIGAVDLWMVSHHGQPSANSKALVHAIAPRVAIMNNGTRKGGQPEVMDVIYTAPGLENLWQLHFSVLSGQKYAVPGLFIANDLDEPQETVPVEPAPGPVNGEKVPVAPVHEGVAYWIKVSAQRDGSFTVVNSRNGFSKTYRGQAD